MVKSKEFDFCESYWCGEYIPTIMKFKKKGQWEQLSTAFQQELIKEEEEALLFRRMKEKMKRSAYKHKRKVKSPSNSKIENP